MIANWRDCLAYPVRYIFGYRVGKMEVVDFLDMLQELLPIEDKGSKFDSISGWLSKCHYDLHIITTGEYHDCVNALANNI